MAIARSLSQLFSRPTSRGGPRRQGARRNPAANRSAMVMESLEKRAMLAITATFATGVLFIDYNTPGTSTANQNAVIEIDEIGPSPQTVRVNLYRSSNPNADVFTGVTEIIVNVPGFDLPGVNNNSLTIKGLESPADRIIMVGSGRTAAGRWFDQLPPPDQNQILFEITGIDNLTLTAGGTINVSGSFTNDTADASITVIGTSLEAEDGRTPYPNQHTATIVLGENTPQFDPNAFPQPRLESNYIHVIGAAIEINADIYAEGEVSLKTSEFTAAPSSLLLPYDITVAANPNGTPGRLDLFSGKSVIQQSTSTIRAALVNVVAENTLNPFGAAVIDLSSHKNDFDEITIRTGTALAASTGSIAIRDSNDLVITSQGLLSTTGLMTVMTDGKLTIDTPIQAGALKAYSGSAIDSTKRGTLTIGDGGIDLTARAVATSATGDLTLNGRIEIGSNSLPAVVINNSIRSDGVITIAGGFYAPQGGATLVEGLAGVSVASPVQVGHTFVNATSTEFVVTDADLTLVSSTGFVDILDFSGNAAIPQAVQATNMLSIDAFADIFIDGQVFVGTRYGNVIGLVETVALPNIFIRGQADITIGQTGRLETSSYETDADLHVNPLVGAIKIVDATQFTNFGRIVADGALEIDIRGDIYLTGGISARESIFATTSLGIIDVQGAVEATGFSYTTSPPAPLEVRRVPNITFAAPAGSITTSTLGTLRAGTAVIAAGEVAIEAHGQITLAAQQDVIIGADIDTKGAVDVSSKIGAIEIDALVRTANGQPVRLTAAEGIDSFEFGRIVTERLEATNTTAFDIRLLNQANRIEEFEALNLAADGEIAGYSNRTVTLQRMQAVRNITVESSQTMTVRDQIGSNEGDITLTSQFGGVNINSNIIADVGDVVLQSSGSGVILSADVISTNSLAISAKTGINQLAGLVKAESLTLDNLTATPIVMASGGNDVDRFAAKNAGAVTFADANGFRVGISSVGPMGVELSGSSVSLSAGGTIRVVAGIATQGLTITAGSVEYVTTSSGDIPGQPFAGTLRDMIAVSNQNLDRQTPEAMVFDEQLVDGNENPLPAVSTITVGTASLPAFTRPITFDGSRVLPTAPGGRLGLLGRSGLPSGLHLGLGSSGSRVTGAAVFGFTTGSGVIVESANNTVDNMYVGLRPNGVTVSPNRLGVNVSGVRANSNTIGTVMYNSLTDGVVSTLRVTNRGEQAAGSTPNVIVTIAPPVGGGTAATAQAVVEEIRPGLYGLTGLVLTNPGSGYEIGENPAITFVGMPGATANSIVAIQTKANHFTGNSDAAIVVQRGASNNLIAGNVVGVPGRTPNRTGVRIDGGSGNQVGTAAQTTDDLTPTPSNLIRGNTHYGVEIRNVRGATTVVENNIVAHNAVREGQGVHGVGVLNSMNVRIGGVSELAANQIHSQRFGGGVHLSGSTNVVIVGNHIGTDGYHLTANGHFPDAVPVWPDMGGGLGNSPFMGNGRHGIDVFGRSRDVEITANRIVDNRGSGVAIASGSSGVVLTRNEIGAWVHPVTGNIHAAGNLADGVTITAANGNTVGSGNVIGFNKGSGVHVENSVAAGLATGNRVAGAEIFGNSGHGVNVSGSSRQTIGGAGGDDGNIIKENLLDGIRLGADPRVRASAAPHGNLVSGNFVGTNDNEEIDRNWGNRNGISVIDGVSNVLSRNTVMNNRDHGIEIAGGVGNTVGGPTTSEGNFIGYNYWDGVLIHDQASTRRDVGVTGTVITAQGAGYSASRTNVIFTAPAVEGGVPARGVALISADGRVTGIRLTSSGSGYATGEAVTVMIFDPLATASATATVTLGTIQAVSPITRGHVVSGNEIEANAGAGVHVMGDRTTEVQVGQNPDNLRSIGAANKISFHHVGVLVNAAMRTRVQGNVYGDNGSPLEMVNGANDRLHGTQTEVLDLRSTQMGIGQTLVTGQLVNGGAFHQYSIDVYDTPYWDISYDSNGVPSGHQMRRFLGRALVTTDGLGRATISMTISQAMELGDYVSVKVTSTRYEPGTTVGVFHSEHRHGTPLLPTPSPSNPTPTPTPGTATPPSGSSGTTGQIPTPPRGSVPPSRL